MKPILFNTEMVRAILDGRKTFTRRVIKPQPLDKPMSFHDEEDGVCIVCHIDNSETLNEIIPPFQPGDILYVRETWLELNNDHVINGKKYAYKADCTAESERIRAEYGYKWRPSIHMPKKAARIFLRVTDVKAQRLLTPFFAHGTAVLAFEREGMMLPPECVKCLDCRGKPSCIDASDDSECEGIHRVRAAFSNIWDSTIPRHPNKFKRYPYYWNDNPWVWVIEFERCEKPEVET